MAGAVRSARELPGQQRLTAVGGEDGFAEVAGGIDVVELGGLDQGVEGRGDGCSLAGLRAEVIPAADDGTANGALGRVVVEWDARILDEAGEPLPVGDGVRGSVADRELLERGQVPQP